MKTSHYPRRNDFGGARASYVASLIDKLSELERKTNPEGGARTAKRKDLAAFRALRTAGKLVNALAGWALDHQAGLALKNLKLDAACSMSRFPPHRDRIADIAEGPSCAKSGHCGHMARPSIDVN